jgi:hypothetical protein
VSTEELIIKAKTSNQLLLLGLIVVFVCSSIVEAELPGTIDLVTTEAPVTILGAESNNKIGWSLAGGDYNGDGQPDIAILARSEQWETNPPFVTILWSTVELDSVVDLQINSFPNSIVLTADGDAGTWSTLTSGDVNGDSIDDLAVGIVTNSQFNNYDGKVYLVCGSRSFPDTLSLANPSLPVTVFEGVPGSAGWLGASMTTGDINGDMRDELVVSARAFWPGGRVYIIYGRETFASTVQLDTLQTGVTRVIDSYLNQSTGFGLASEDVDGDGYDDLFVGSPGSASGLFQGTASFLLGGSSLPDVIPLSDTTSGVKRFYGHYDHGQLGWRVSLGDVNGDGDRDLIMSAPVADPFGCDDCGEVYAVYWDEALPDSVHMSTTDVRMTRFIGAGVLQDYGLEMVTGDLNGDGCDDIIMKREPDQYDPANRRSVLIAYGGPSLLDSIFLESDTTTTRIIAEQPGDDFGRGLAVWDIDNDGVTDLCVGAPFANVPGRAMTGKVRVFYGFMTPSGSTGTVGSPFVLKQNYPNPFNPGTTIAFSIAEESDVELLIYDVRGALVRTLVRERREPNDFRVVWNGKNNAGISVASGVYFYRLTAGDFRTTKKMVLLK